MGWNHDARIIVFDGERQRVVSTMYLEDTTLFLKRPMRDSRAAARILQRIGFSNRYGHEEGSCSCKTIEAEGMEENPETEYTRRISIILIYIYNISLIPENRQGAGGESWILSHSHVSY